MAGLPSSPQQVSQAGTMGAIGSLNQALQSNAQAYGGLQNQALQQYQQNAGAVQSNLANSGLGNTTVAQTMQQAPLQTLNNALLNITGQQQGQASNLYGQAAGVQQSGGNSLAQLLLSLQGLQQNQNQFDTTHARPNVSQTGL
jgi:hypothetical protein